MLLANARMHNSDLRKKSDTKTFNAHRHTHTHTHTYTHETLQAVSKLLTDILCPMSPKMGKGTKQINAAVEQSFLQLHSMT